MLIDELKYARNGFMLREKACSFECGKENLALKKGAECFRGDNVFAICKLQTITTCIGCK